MDNQICEKVKKQKFLNAFLILLGMFLLTLIISNSVDIQKKLEKSENTLSVTANGEIYAKPDLALVDFSVVSEAKTVAEAVSKNTEDMNAVIAVVKEKGVGEKDLKTTSFNISPRYEWKDNCSSFSSYCPYDKRVLVGYEVSQSLEVKIRDMAKIGEIIQGAANKGANQVGSLSFTIDNQDELKSQARAQAIEKAKARAKELASRLGINLIRISNFQENGVYPVYFKMAESMAVPSAPADQTTRIETGENKIEITVTLTYDIN